MLTDVLSALRINVLEIEIYHAFKRTINITTLDLSDGPDVPAPTTTTQHADPIVPPPNPLPVAEVAAAAPQDVMGDYLKALDMKEFATELAQRIPPLNQVGIYVHWLPISQSYWEVSRTKANNTSQVLLSRVGDFDTGKRRFWRGPEGKDTI